MLICRIRAAHVVFSPSYLRSPVTNADSQFSSVKQGELGLRRFFSCDLTAWKNRSTEEVGGKVWIFTGANVQTQCVTIGRLRKAIENTEPLGKRKRLGGAGARADGQLGGTLVTRQHSFKTLVPVRRQSRFLEMPLQGTRKAGTKEQNAGGDVPRTGLNRTRAKGFEICRSVGKLGQNGVQAKRHGDSALMEPSRLRKPNGDRGRVRFKNLPNGVVGRDEPNLCVAQRRETLEKLKMRFRNRPFGEERDLDARLEKNPQNFQRRVLNFGHGLEQIARRTEPNALWEFAFPLEFLAQASGQILIQPHAIFAGKR